MNNNTNYAVALISNTTKQLESVELSAVNSAILAKVPTDLQSITSAIMKANQYSSGVSIVLCKLLFELKSNSAALKASPYKNFSNFAKDVLRLDPAQSSRYSAMYERLFYDNDKNEQIEKFAKDGFTVAQLVSLSLLKDRTIRSMLCDIVIADYSCTNINKAVSYLKDFNKESLEQNVIDWNIVKDLLEKGNSEKLVKPSDTKSGDTTADTTADTVKADNICEFTNLTDFDKWRKANKSAIVKITVVIEK